MLGAYHDGHRVGGAVIAFDTPGVDLLEGRSDLALLWDIRVRPEGRRKGIGTRLFRAGEQWARARACTQIKIETQNVNVPACRFYARQGCVLRVVNRVAYTMFQDEIQLPCAFVSLTDHGSRIPSRESELELSGLKPAFIALPLSNRPSQVLSASIVTPSDSSQRAARTVGTPLGNVFERIGAHGDASFSAMMTC